MSRQRNGPTKPPRPPLPGQRDMPPSSILIQSASLPISRGFPAPLYLHHLNEGIRIVIGVIVVTLQGINISHLGKRKIIFKMQFLGDMLVPWRVLQDVQPSTILSAILSISSSIIMIKIPSVHKESSFAKGMTI